MREPREPLFLARQSYRRRRLMDAARLLPLLGLLLFVLPLIWNAPYTASGWLYLFVCWVLLIVVAFLLSRRLASGEMTDPEARMDEER